MIHLLVSAFLAFKKSSSVWVLLQLFIATKTRPLSFPSQLRWVIFFSSYLKECHLSNICQLSYFCQYQPKLHAKCVYMEFFCLYPSVSVVHCTFDSTELTVLIHFDRYLNIAIQMVPWHVSNDFSFSLNWNVKVITNQKSLIIHLGFKIIVTLVSKPTFCNLIWTAPVNL